MAGVPGQPSGPTPKRSGQRHGHRSKAEQDAVDKVVLDAAEVEPPPAVESWHPIAKAWYESLAESGQSLFYEPSDWATAFVLAESLSRDLKPQFVGTNEQTGEPIIKAIPMRGASLAAYLKGMAVLLATEGDRRRARLELTRGPVPEAEDDVPSLDDYRERLG